MNEFNTSYYIKVLAYDDNPNEAVMFFKITKFFLENRQDTNDIFEIINELTHIFTYSLISSYITYHPYEFPIY